ncbi:MAG: phenylalanine--tRNA ligase subunit beta [Candidatus Pacebacteria bacterium]|nr:phenylalanine--tRNA ligase subunit beta [Candidatus Paceibacterota bacterium]
MNILIPHSWLLEHLDTEATPKQIQDYLSLSGPSVERINDHNGEPVYDIEVTTNRVDSMSIRGIAREAAAILPQFGVVAKLKPLNLPNVSKANNPLPLPRILENDELNNRTICVVLSSVNRTETPKWMADRLEQIEMNVHDAVIDITNYITHELGYPCHAFDYDKLVATGNEIRIVEAGAGETFETLDGESFTAVGGEVVFKNGEGTIIDLPSIKGTKNTSIDESTKNVLLLMESIDAKKVRFASMTHSIRTTAAQLMEKNVDPNLASDVMKMGVKLYQELCQAEVSSEVYDHFPNKIPPTEISLTTIKLSEYLGFKLSLEDAAKMLEKLECNTSIAGDVLAITPPSFRPDIAIPADIIEEVARIYGYHNIPSVLMPTAIPLNRPKATNFGLEHRAKEFLSAIGWQEVYTYSMVSETEAKTSGFNLENHLKVSNPLTDDKVYLRRSLVPSLESVIDGNTERSSISVFELANIYIPQEKDLPNEELTLAMVSNRDYRTVRGDLELLFTKLHIYNTLISPLESDDQVGNIMVNGTPDSIGQIAVKNGRVTIQLKMAKLVQLSSSHPTYKALPKTAALIEDLTFTLKEKTKVGELIKALTNADSLIEEVNLKTIYNRNFTFTIIYRHPDQPISSEMVAPIRKQLVALVESDWQGHLVGELAN